MEIDKSGGKSVGFEPVITSGKANLRLKKSKATGKISRKEPVLRTKSGKVIKVGKEIKIHKKNAWIKNVIKQKFFPTYGDSPGHYMVDTFFMRSNRYNDKKKKKRKIKLPGLIMMHLNFRIAFIAFYPLNFVKKPSDDDYGMRTRSEDPREKDSISVESKGALEALKEIINVQLPAFKQKAKQMFDVKDKDLGLLDVKTLQSDDGGEFKKEFAEYCQQQNIHQYRIQPSETGKRAMGVIERMIRTLRQYIDAHKFVADLDMDEFEIPVDIYKKVFPDVMEAYNWELPHRYVHDFFKWEKGLAKKLHLKGRKNNEFRFPGYFASDPERYDTLIEKWQSEKTKEIGDYWKPVIKKILNEGGYPIRSKDDLFGKESFKRLRPYKNDFKVHLYKRRHQGDPRSVHRIRRDHNPIRIDNENTITGGTVRSLESLSSSRRYMPYDVDYKY